MSKMHPICKNDSELYKMIPDSSPGADGERRLYRFFRDFLPNEWEVFYNVSITGSVDHQLDFVVIVPGKGIVNVDAKGGGYSLRDGMVYLGDTPSPIYQQASGAIHSVDEYIKTHMTQGNAWGAFDFLVVFTKTKEVVSAGEENHAFSIVGADNNAQHIASSLERRIVALLDRHRGVQQYFSGNKNLIVGRFASNLVPFEENLKYADWDKLSEQMLTTPQKKVFAELMRNNYCHVKGGAGTGKTIISMAIAKKYAEQGKKVLYVCFNKALADMLKRRYEQQQFKISSFYQVGTVFGRNLNLIGAESFDRSRADAELERIVKIIPATQKFNVLIIDEAQDLTDRNFRILFSILKADRKVVLFSDAEQTIFSYDNSGGWDYNEKSLFQDAEVSQLRLEMNYRNAKPIHERISQYEDQKTTVYFDEDTLGNHITDVKTNISKDDIYKTLSQILENNSPKDIVVLSFEKDDISKLSRFKDVKGRNVSFTTDVADWENGEKILKTTVQSFKGLEANIVVLFMSNVAQINDKLKYVAESRAKYELYIVE